MLIIIQNLKGWGQCCHYKRSIIAMKVMANVKMTVVLSIFSFATDGNWTTLSFSIGNRWWQSNHVINDDRVVWGEGEYEVGVGRIIGVVKRVLPDLTRHDRTLDLSLTTSFSSITSTTIMRYSMNRCGDCAVDGDLSNLPLLSNATRSVRVQGTNL